MHRILIEGVRRKNSLKRGGKHVRVEFNRLDTELGGQDEQLLALTEAPDGLSEHDACRTVICPDNGRTAKKDSAS
jgi:hypothetical protein